MSDEAAAASSLLLHGASEHVSDEAVASSSLAVLAEWAPSEEFVEFADNMLYDARAKVPVWTRETDRGDVETLFRAASYLKENVDEAERWSWLTLLHITPRRPVVEDWMENCHSYCKWLQCHG